MSKNLKIFNINLNGIYNRSLIINEIILQINPDIIFFQETKRTKLDSSFFIPNYHVIESLATSEQNINGLIVAIKKHLKKCMTVSKIDNFYIKIQLKSPNKEILNLINVYLPCNTINRTLITHFIKNELNHQPNTICMGDFNTDKKELIQLLNIDNIPNFTLSTNHSGSRLVKLQETNRILDFTISNNPNLIKTEKYLADLHLSDHYGVETEINWHSKLDKPTEKIICDRRKLINNEKIRNKLRNLKYQALTNKNMSAQEQFTSFYTAIKDFLFKKKILKPEANTEKTVKFKSIEKLINRRKSITNEEELKEINKQIAIKSRKIKRINYEKFLKYGCDRLKRNQPRDAWKWLKRISRLNKQNQCSNSIRDPVTGEVVSDDKQISEVMRVHLSKLAEKENEKVKLTKTEISEDRNKRYKINETLNNIASQSDEPITWSEIRDMLKKSRNYKAASKDLLPCEVYKVAIQDKKCKTRMSKMILQLFNICLQTGFTPNEWSENIVVLIYKKGDSTNPDNYRGITLINTLSKIYCKVLANRLAIINNEFNLIRKEQTGFIHGEIGTNTVTSVVEIVERRKLLGLETWLLFIDFKKAYDLVPHSILIEKLHKKKLGPKFISSISNLYNETKLTVRTGDTYSEYFEYNRGVRQGCPTSPLLFDIFIDDLLDNMNGIMIPKYEGTIPGLCFADDTLILGESLEDIQSKTKLIEKWCENNYMEVNINKCGLMSIPNNNPSITTKLNNLDLIRVIKYTYLGVELNDALDFKEMANYRIGVGISTLETIKHMLVNSQIPMLYKMMLIKSILIPRITYGIEVFGHNYTSISNIKKIVNSSIKLATGRFNVSISSVQREFNIIPIEAFAKYMQLKSINQNTNSQRRSSKLFKNDENIIKKRGIHRTRMLETKQFIKRYNITITNRHRMKNQIKKLFRSKKAFEPKNKTNELRNKYKLDSCKKLHKEELDLSTRELAKFIINTRLNITNNANYLIRRKLIDSSWKDKCLLCEKEAEDNIEHWILECTTFKPIITQNLQEILTLINTYDDENKDKALLNIILRGNLKIKTPKKLIKLAKKQINKTISNLIEMRKSKIKQTIINKTILVNIHNTNKAINTNHNIPALETQPIPLNQILIDPPPDDTILE